MTAHRSVTPRLELVALPREPEPKEPEPPRSERTPRAPKRPDIERVRNPNPDTIH